MSYFLPFQNRTRFVAFKDTPAIEKYLSDWLPQEKTWDDLKSDEFLQSSIVEGESILGIFFERDKTFVTNAIGNPQIKFEEDPKSLLFVFSHYNVIDSSNTFSYDKLSESYIRREISFHSYAPSTENIQGIIQELNRIDLEKLGPLQAQSIENLILSLRSDVTKLAKRNDPVSIILPIVAAESAQRKEVIQDILTQLNSLQPTDVPGAINLTNYPTKDEFYDKLWRKTDKGYVDGLLASKASQTELTNHINDPSHNPTYVQVGSPSRAEHVALSNRVLSSETKFSSLEDGGLVKKLQTKGGITASNKGNGIWEIDASYIGVGTGDKPQETSWFQDGLLAIEQGAGRWRIWENSTIIGVALTVETASIGAPIVVDIKKNGISLYTSTPRPTLSEGVKSILAPIPDEVDLIEGDFLTVDIINVGTVSAGSDLTIQVRYQYVN